MVAFSYYSDIVYCTHKRGEGDIVVEGDDLRVGSCVGLCDYSL